jgi:HPr kinase/phosphorylase
MAISVTTTPSTVHASAVLIGARAILIRGPSGAGKSQLVQTILQAAGSQQIPFARLVADDRVLLEAAHGRLLVRPPAALAGLLEVRGVGIVRLPYEPAAQVSFVVDLLGAESEEKAARLPEASDAETTILGIRLPHLVIGAGHDPLPLIRAKHYLTTDSEARTV